MYHLLGLRRELSGAIYTEVPRRNSVSILLPPPRYRCYIKITLFLTLLEPLCCWSDNDAFHLEEADVPQRLSLCPEGDLAS